jgi:hypothetical protein
MLEYLQVLERERVDARRARWVRIAKVSRGMFHKHADAEWPGQALLWSKLTDTQQAKWLERAAKHVDHERRAGKELAYD